MSDFWTAAEIELLRSCMQLRKENNELRDQVKKLESKFESFMKLVIEKTAVELKGETHWPEWLVTKLDEMGLWVR